MISAINRGQSLLALALLLVACADTLRLDATPQDLDADHAPRDRRAAADRAARDAVAPIDPACRVNGCLRAHRTAGSYSRAVVEGYLDPGVTISNGYTVHWILYFTDGRTSSATVTIPYDPETPPPGGYHVVANNHGTVGLEDPCAPSASVAGTGLAGLFGGRGAIGLAVDYPGLGTPGLHPYLVSRVEATSVLDGLRATRQLARLLGKPLSGRQALVGLSQGGHATLVAAALQSSYAPELELRAIGVEGPATVWEQHWASSVAIPGPHVAYHAMLVYAWAAHYGWTTPLWTAATAATIDATMTQRCYWAASGPTIVSQLPQDATQIFHAGLLQEWNSRSWKSYVALHDAFEANAVRPFPQPAPIRVYQGDADQDVPEAQTRQVVEALKAAGMKIDYQVVPGGAHGAVAFGYLAYPQLRTAESIAWVRALLDAP
jgi:dienelactone hydrolase